MKALFYKQFRLAAHPTTYVFCLFAVMLMIPSYPYTVAFFYTTLGLFFTFQNAREQRDSAYTALLPVRKCDAVRASVLFSAVIELSTLLLSVPFVLLKAKGLQQGGNLAGIDANAALLGLAFLLFAVFNGIFFPAFYRSGYKAGSAFLKASAGVFLLVVFDVLAPHLIPLLDGYHAGQYGVLAFGAAVFVGITALSCRISERRYEKVDL